MSSDDMPIINAHEDVELFREATRFTSAETAFSPRLIEKDYFCTLMLSYFSTATEIVFKGGTCLAKVHAGFYRLSEDLDFAISMPANASKKQRSTQADAMRRVIKSLPPVFRVTESLRGANLSTQYIGAISYVSILDGHTEPILIELSLREPLLTQPINGLALTSLILS